MRGGGLSWFMLSFTSILGASSVLTVEPVIAPTVFLRIESKMRVVWGGGNLVADREPAYFGASDCSVATVKHISCTADNTDAGWALMVFTRFRSLRREVS